MPQTSPERRARWPGGDEQAIKYLEDAGYSLTFDWCWIRPQGRWPTKREIDAVAYLVEEWDFGGMRKAETNEPPFRTKR